MDSHEYWKRREQEQLRHNITSEAEYQKCIGEIYGYMMDQIQKEINGFYTRYAKKDGITLSEAKKQRTDAVRGVLLFGVFQLVCVAGFIMLCLIPDLPRWAVILFAACAAATAAPMAAALAVLKKRFDEIQGGELDAARQY